METAQELNRTEYVAEVKLIFKQFLENKIDKSVMFSKLKTIEDRGKSKYRLPRETSIWFKINEVIFDLEDIERHIKIRPYFLNSIFYQILNSDNLEIYFT